MPNIAHRWIIVPKENLEVFKWTYKALTGEEYVGELCPYGERYRSGTGRLQDGFVQRLLDAPFNLEIWDSPRDREFFSVEKHAFLPDANEWDGRIIYVENPSYFGLIKKGVYSAQEGKWVFTGPLED